MKYYGVFFTETRILVVLKGTGLKVANKILQSFFLVLDVLLAVSF